MNKFFILLVLAGLSLAMAAQDGSQPLPSAPSATKYPPKQTTQPQQPQSAPATSEQPAANSATSNTSGSSAPANSGSAPSTAAALPGGAATPPPSEPDDVPLTTITKRVDEVNVVFTVTDKRGKFVKDLKQNDFQVMDDSHQGTVRSFRSETNLPLRVGLLIDASNSVRDRFKFEQEAAVEFLNQIIRSNFDRAFVIGFDTTPEVTQDFTDNTEALAKGVHMLRPGGGTAMYDAIYYACRDKLMAYDKGNVATRRAIILLSDGEDNQSRVSREEALEMAQKAEVIIYAISTNTSGLKLRGDKVLEYFADQTGGRAFFPFKIQDVSDAFSQIQDELRSQYAISYKPADFQFNGKYHKIDILADNKKYKVRARKGYYAPTQ
jgi:Ca-activated chloride channel homolog